MAKWIRDAVGEPRRLWYDNQEIEQIVGKSVAAFRGGSDLEVLDLEAFAEQHCGVALDQHALLPDNVLGVTEFSGNGPCRISINRALTLAADDQPASIGVVGRWRATLAHELGHVLLHRILYAHHEDQIELFAPQVGGVSSGEMRCFRSDIGTSARTTDWREVQANKGMAALLMPAGRFGEAFEQLASVLGPMNAEAAARSLVDKLARRFLVSRQAALIRISEMDLAMTRTPLL